MGRRQGDGGEKGVKELHLGDQGDFGRISEGYGIIWESCARGWKKPRCCGTQT